MATFELAGLPEHEGIFTTTSHLTGEKINRFCNIHQSPEDLLAKQEMTRIGAREVGGCIARCMGIDALNAISVITKQCDMAHDTEYHDRYLAFMKEFQAGDKVGCCAQTDVKGDRSLRPGDQSDPDLYLRVVEKRPDGIVVRGAKAHNSFAPMADEIIVTPTRFLRPNESDWAVAFAIPGDAPGIKQVVRAAKHRERAPEVAGLISGKGECESLTIFDDVFVPWERVFLCGEQRVRRAAGPALLPLPPAQLHRLQAGGHRHHHGLRRPGGGVLRHRAGGPRPFQAGPPHRRGRTGLRMRHRRCGEIHQDPLGHPDAGRGLLQRGAQARGREHLPRVPDPGRYRRGPARHPALRLRVLEPRGGGPGEEVPQAGGLPSASRTSSAAIRGSPTSPARPWQGCCSTPACTAAARR